MLQSDFSLLTSHFSLLLAPMLRNMAVDPVPKPAQLALQVGDVLALAHRPPMPRVARHVTGFLPLLVHLVLDLGRLLAQLDQFLARHGASIT